MMANNFIDAVKEMHANMANAQNAPPARSS
jgi:hypothetical protein